MENEIKYGQQDFNLPHDVIKLPSKGIFYKNKKSSIKIGYLTASDENILMSENNREGLIKALLKQKIYEPGFDVNDLIDCDLQAILIFLRNSSFGPEYNFSLKDPITSMNFETTIILDEIDYIDPIHKPDENGYFSYTLPKSNASVKVKLLNLGEQTEVDNITKNYPTGMVSPVITKKLEYQIVELNNTTDKGQISKFISQMPIMDSKKLREFISQCEPKIDLKRKVIAPSGEEVTVDIAFGVEFFRPFF